MAEKGGKFLGLLPENHPYSDPFAPWSEVLNPKLFGGKSPEEFMQTRPEGEEGYFLPGSNLLWIRTPEEPGPSVPMSYLDPEAKNA